MKLSYGISFEDFQALQPPFTSRAAKNTAFKTMLVVCGLMAALGVFCMVEGLGAPVGLFLIGLGAMSAVLGYFYDQHSVKKAKEQYVRNIKIGYQKLHCRDQRSLEWTADGFTVSCKCGTLSRPWSELIHISENGKFFLLGAKAGPVVVPKSAFASQAEQTEFRTFISERLNQDRSLTARRLEFACNADDYRRAHSLHNRQGGGWRLVVKGAVTLACIALGVVILVRAMTAPRNPAIVVGLVGGLLGVPLLRLARVKRARYYGPLEIRFSDEGLFLRDTKSEARYRWTDYIGYLADDHVMLLYANPRLYRIVPKRAMGNNDEFKAMVEKKLPKYDYRNPIPVKDVELAKGAAAS